MPQKCISGHRNVIFSENCYCSYIYLQKNPAQPKKKQKTYSFWKYNRNRQYLNLDTFRHLYIYDIYNIFDLDRASREGPACPDGPPLYYRTTNSTISDTRITVCLCAWIHASFLSPATKSPFSQ